MSVRIHISACDIDFCDFVQDLSRSDFGIFMDELKDSSHWPDWCESEEIIRVDNIDDAEEAIKKIDEIHPRVIGRYLEDAGYVHKDEPGTMLAQFVDNQKDFMLENVYRYFTPAEIFEWLVLFYPSYLRLNKDQGGDREYVARMSHLHMVQNKPWDEELMWLTLMNNYPKYLGERIGELVLKGQSNGNT